jgi:3-hydroxybutyryl-CoA dehydratase
MSGGRIAHGMSTASFISSLLGTELPCPSCIYPHQDLRGHAPIRQDNIVCSQNIITDANTGKNTSTRIHSTALAAHRL